jgi:recA bacterial DNA recombination protein
MSIQHAIFFFPMAASANIFDFRKLLAERFPHVALTTATRLTTGLPFLDEAIGGLPHGAITELISPGTSAGSASLIHALIHCAYRDNYFLALIDGHDSFDACGLKNAWLQHLLWIRCSKASEAIKAADLLLRDGNFPLVIVDLVLNAPHELRKIPQTNWYRLQRLVEMVPTACLVLTRYEMVASAQVKLVLENSWDIRTFETQDALSPLRIIVKRSHLQSEVSRLRYLATASQGSQKAEVS